MSHQAHIQDRPEQRTIAPLASRLFMIGLIVGVLGLVGATLVSGFNWQVLGSSYLTGWAFWLSISLSALFFVILHHLTRAGWSTSVRRILELMASNTITLAVLGIPVVIGIGVIYHWAHPEGDAALMRKAVWLNPLFFTLRLALYFAVWIAIALWFWRNSVRQDSTADHAITEKLQRWSGGMIVLFALTVNWAYFDLLMSLDPHWYSTVFSVYIFGGGNVAMFSLLALMGRWLQRRGILEHSITREHYHDMGKWMFAWTFFWGYIAYSQYMLIWYGNIPEETAWFFRRGADTHDLYDNAWSIISLTLLFAHLLIPFAGLLSRHTKRHVRVLQFWAVWILVFHFVDLAWVVMPETQIVQEMVEAQVGIGEQIGPMFWQIATALLCTIGVGGFWLAGLVKLAGSHSIVPTADPRLGESLAYHNL